MALVDDKVNDLRPINSGYIMRNYTAEEYDLIEIVSTCMYIVFESLKRKKKVWKVNTCYALNYYLYVQIKMPYA